MRNTKYSKLFLLSIAVLSGMLCLHSIRQRLRQDQLDRRLLRALHTYDTKTALATLAEGANPNARDLPELHPSLMESLKSLFRCSGKPLPTLPTALLVAIDWRWRDQVYKGGFVDTTYVPANPPPQDPSVIRALLEHGAHVNVLNEADLTPLQIAAWEGNSSTVQLLLEHGAATNINRYSCKIWKGTPLTYAISAQSVPTVQVLLKYHADINTIHDGYGQTAIEVAQAYHTKAIAHLLDQCLQNH